MPFKPRHVGRKCCLPLCILCVELSRFSKQTIIEYENVYQNKYNLSYVKLETKKNFQNVVTFVLVKIDTKFKVQNS